MLSVLTYHAIGDLPPPLGISPDRFAWQMAWLQDQGIDVVPLGRALEMEAHRNGPRAVAITFDDGYESVARLAMPVLARAGFAATVFVVCRHVGGTNRFPGQPAWVPECRLADWSALREMHAAGWSVEAHGLTHRRLDTAGADDIDREMRGSIDEIGTAIGGRPCHFAYPYGLHSAATREAASRHFASAWTAAPGVVRAVTATDRYALPRVDAYDVTSKWLFPLIASDVIAPYLAMRREARRLRRALTSG